MVEDEVEEYESVYDSDSDVYYEASTSEFGEETHVRKIEIDSKLKLSKTVEDVKTEIYSKVIIYDTFDDKLGCNMPAFPTDYTLAKLASLAYSDCDKQQDLPSGWQFLTAAWNSHWNNGYYGCAYFNAQHQQIVIAHRGTKVSSPNDLYTDRKGIYKTKFVAQMNSAATFTEMILSLINELNQNGAYLKLSFTGHSLGGWLARVTTFTAKYLTINGRKGQFSRIARQTQTVYHGHTVVFESPGCKQMLKKLKTEYIRYRYGDENINEISIDSLDITTYLSAPNRINCCHAHVGKLYRLSVKLLGPDSNENDNRWRVTKWAFSVGKSVVNWGRKRFLYTIDTHGLNKIIECFDPQTGLVKRDGEGRLEVQEVLNWPIIEGIVSPGIEYDEVIKWLSQFENYHLSVDETFSDKHEICYQTKCFNKNSFKFNVFSEAERNFVEGYDIRRFFPKYESVIFSVHADDSKSVLHSAIRKLDSMKFQIDRDNHVPLLGPNIKPLEFISYVKQLNHFFPNLNRMKQITKSFTVELVTAIYKTESDEYLSPIAKNLLEFDVGVFNLSQFLIKEKPQVLLQVENDTSVGALKIYKKFESVKVKTKYGDGKSMFLDMKRILRIKQLSFGSVMDQIGNNYLIAIENNENSKSAVDLLKEIIEKVRGNEKIKMIVIVDGNSETNWTEIVGEHERSDHEGLQLSDLSSDSRKQILNRELINLQGHRVSLAQIIPSLKKSKSAELTPNSHLLKSVIRPEILLKLGNQEEIKAGSELDESEDCYIKRILTRYEKTVNLMSLRSNKDDIYVIGNSDACSSFLQGRSIYLISVIEYRRWVHERDQFGRRMPFIILDVKKAENQLKDICKFYPNKNVHWLRI